MRMSLATPEKLLYEGELQKLTLIADKGQIQILENHAPLLTLVKPGAVLVNEAGGSERNFQVSDGVLKVDKNQISILVRSAVEGRA